LDFYNFLLNFKEEKLYWCIREQLPNGKKRVENGSNSNNHRISKIDKNFSSYQAQNVCDKYILSITLKSVCPYFFFNTSRDRKLSPMKSPFEI